MRAASGPPIAWPAGPIEPPSLGDRVVHVWCTSLDVPDERLAALESTLSAAEHARADRFRFAPHRRRWIVSRATLRVLLGRYLRATPAALRFTVGPEGKPALDGSAARQLQFNLAHSDAMGLYAVTAAAEVGVDVERIQDIPDAAVIAESHFSVGEREALRTVSPVNSTTAFFDCWTRKEAYIKAIGAGLSIPLSGFEVAVAPGEPCRLIHMNGDRDAAAAWSLSSLTPAAGYTGAVALRAPGIDVSVWSIS